MSKLVAVHCICILVCSVAVSSSVITIQVMLQFVITKKQILSVFMISTIVKIPIETTKRIKAFELMNSFCVSLFFSHFLLSQTPNPNMRHMQTFYSY